MSLVGVWKTLLLVVLSNATTECAADSDQHVWSEPNLETKWYDFSYCFILKLSVIFGAILFRKNVLQFCMKLSAGIALVYRFVAAVDSFIVRFEVDRENVHTVQSVLFNCLYEDAPLTSSKDPEKRVQNFFAKIDADISELSSKCSCDRKEIVRWYISTLYYQNQSRNRRRKGLVLSRDDLVRLQYGALRIAHAAILNHFSNNPEMAATATTVSKDESAENLNHKSNKVNEERETQIRGNEAHECVHVKKDDDVTVTTAAESLGDPNPGESICGGSEPKSAEDQNCESNGTGVLEVESQHADEVSDEKTRVQETNEVCERVHAKKEDDFTVTVGTESLGDPDASEFDCEEKYFSVVINGTLFKGIGGPTHDVNSCEPDSGNDIGSGAEETLKERNRRLLAKERERLKQRKPKIQKQRGKYKSCEDISKSIKVKSTAVIENHVNEGTMTRDENYSEQKEISRVDRQWELELVSRMRDKIRTKV